MRSDATSAGRPTRRIIGALYLRTERITMSLLDSILGGLMSGGGAPAQQGQNPLLMMAMQMIQQNGGLPGIISKLQQGGLGNQANSWVGTGQNLPVSGDQLSSVLGGGDIGRLAQQFGLSHGDANSGLAQMLPQIIDKMTPHGQVPDDHGDMLAQALSALTQRRG
jgi:uncharacterized protein YidB (DUF937 family)